MGDYRIHPAFGILTDPEEIRIFDRQQAEEDMEKAYWEAQEQAAYRAYEEAAYRAYEEAYYQAMYEYYWMSLMEENEIITESF